MLQDSERVAVESVAIVAHKSAIQSVVEKYPKIRFVERVNDATSVMYELRPYGRPDMNRYVSASASTSSKKCVSIDDYAASQLELAASAISQRLAFSEATTYAIAFGNFWLARRYSEISDALRASRTAHGGSAVIRLPDGAPMSIAVDRDGRPVYHRYTAPQDARVTTATVAKPSKPLDDSARSAKEAVVATETGGVRTAPLADEATPKARRPSSRAAHGADMAGIRSASLVALRAVGSHQHYGAIWLCQCDCGGTIEKYASVIRSGRAKSCGCLRGERYDAAKIAGRVYGKLTAIREVGDDARGKVWEFRCECGNVKQMTYRNARDGVASCGCLVGAAVRGAVENLAGRTFNSLTVKQRASNGASGEVRWACACACGSDEAVIVRTRALLRGLTKTCGCRHQPVATGAPMTVAGEEAA